MLTLQRQGEKMTKPQTAVIAIDENISEVVSTKPIKPNRRKLAKGFTDEQRAKSIAKRQENSIALKTKAAEVFSKLDCHIGKTCRALSINRATFKTWLKEDPQFASAVEDAQQHKIDDAERNIYRASDLLDVQATKFILQTKAKDRGYGEETEGPQTQIAIVWQTAEQKS